MGTFIDPINPGGINTVGDGNISVAPGGGDGAEDAETPVEFTPTKITLEISIALGMG